MTKSLLFPPPFFFFFFWPDKFCRVFYFIKRFAPLEQRKPQNAASCGAWGGRRHFGYAPTPWRTWEVALFRLAGLFREMLEGRQSRTIRNPQSACPSSWAGKTTLANKLACKKCKNVLQNAPERCIKYLTGAQRLRVPACCNCWTFDRTRLKSVVSNAYMWVSWGVCHALPALSPLLVLLIIC